MVTPTIFFQFFSKPLGIIDTEGKKRNNNNHDDIYSAVIMTQVIARVHSVHLVNVEQRQAPSDQATWLGLWVRLL